MAVFLSILKITGIVLLSILGLILLLSAVILFPPVRYTISAVYNDEKKPWVEIRLTWILHSFRFYYLLKGKEKQYYLKFLWIQLRPKKKNKMEEDAFNDLEAALSEDDDIDDTEDTDETGVPEDTGKDQTLLPQEKTGETFEETVYETQVITDDRTAERKKEKKRRTPKELIKEIRSSFYKIRYKFRRICDRIKDGTFKIEDMIEKLRDERTKKAVEELIYEAVLFLKHSKPKKYRFYLNYGFEDPSHTGELFAFYNSLYPLHRGIPEVVPDFNKKCLEADFFLKGGLQPLYVLIVFLRFYFDKDVKRLMEILNVR